MIKQETLADITNPHLPPLTNLPQWSRINTLDKARYPKPFVKDRLHPLASQANKHLQGGNAAELGIDFIAMAELSADNQDASGQTTARIDHLERSLVFIQKEHELTLQSLHAEVDQLKRENKELHFKIINSKDIGARVQSPQSSSQTLSRPRQLGSAGDRTAQGMSSEHLQDRAKLTKKDSLEKDAQNFADRVPKPPSGRRRMSAAKQVSKEDELNLQSLQQENEDLKLSLTEEVNRSMMLSQLLQQAESNGAGKSEGQMSAKSRPSESQSAPVVTQSPLEEIQAGKSRMVTSASMLPSRKEDTLPQMLPYAATIDPLLVNIPPHPARPPTLPECETIIRHLLIKTSRQNHELTRLKSDLKEALYSHKWTPDAYLLAKAYVVDDEAREAAARDRLPKVALSQQNRRLPESAYATKDQASLPPLKQTLGNKAIERRKRTQILQQARRSKEVFY